MVPCPPAPRKHNNNNNTIIIIIQHLYSAMESEDTEALGGARLRPPSASVSSDRSNGMV